MLAGFTGMLPVATGMLAVATGMLAVVISRAYSGSVILSDLVILSGAQRSRRMTKALNNRLSPHLSHPHKKTARSECERADAGWVSKGTVSPDGVFLLGPFITGFDTLIRVINKFHRAEK